MFDHLQMLRASNILPTYPVQALKVHYILAGSTVGSSLGFKVTACKQRGRRVHSCAFLLVL